MVTSNKKNNQSNHKAIEIEWKTIANLVQTMKDLFENKQISRLKFKITAQSPVNDIFSVGKFISFLFFIKNKCNIEVEVEVIANTKEASLVLDSGLASLLKKHAIETSFPVDNKHPPKAEQTSIKLITDAIDVRGEYRCVVVPYDSQTFVPQPVSWASEHLDWVERETDKIIESIRKKIQDASGDCIDIKPEIAKSLLPSIKELITNCLQHSTLISNTTPVSNSQDSSGSILPKEGENIIIYTLVFIRENKPPGSRVIRSNNSLLGWEDRFDILIQDLGQGFLKSIRQTFGMTTGVNNKPYKIDWLWANAGEMQDRHTEQQFLSTVFRGNMVVRQGRKSLGLQSISNMCMRQNGCMNFRSGSAEVLVGERSGGLQVVHREDTSRYWESHKAESVNEIEQKVPIDTINHYWLPGVIAALYIPIYGMKIARSRSLVKSKNIYSDKPDLFRNEYFIRKNLPKGLFGGLSRIKSTRRSETDAFRLYLDESDKCKIIDLKSSGAVDIDFLDSLIQEMCKRSFFEEPEDNQSLHLHPFLSMVFINVPKIVVSALKSRNCDSFLLENGMICTLIDEYDQPHFLGIRRMTDGPNNVDDILLAIYMRGSNGISNAELKELNFNETLISAVEVLFPSAEKAINKKQPLLYYKYNDEKNKKTIFVWPNVIKWLWQEDGKKATARFIQFTHKLKDSFFQMSNGMLIDTTYNFSGFWSDDTVLRSAAKKLSRKADFPLAKTIISFKGNGDILSSAMRDFLGIPELTLLDTENTQSELHFSGSSAILVVDALCPGDDHENSYINQSIKAIKNANCTELYFIAYADLRINKRKSFSGYKVTSLHYQRNADIIAVSNEINYGTPIFEAKQYHENEKQKNNTNSDLPNIQEFSYKDHLPRYGPLELSSEFWHNIAELKIISPGNQTEDLKEPLYDENNEAVIRHPRLRDQLQEFVENFVRNILELRLDVIIHPDHSTGTYLAHLVAKNLAIKPLILPLAKSKYGDPIHVTAREFRDHYEKIQIFRKENRFKQPRCLIVDDSISTGRTIFTMLGLASQLDLMPVGILVLINRLKPETSEAISLFRLSFAYFFRFHMPKLNGQDDPNTRLIQLDDILHGSQENSSVVNISENDYHESPSYFASFWSRNHIRDTKMRNHLRRDLRLIMRDPPKLAKNAKLEIVDKTALQIIQRLLLHPDTRMIDFDTRIAIVFNFMGNLLEADADFTLIDCLHEQGKLEDQYSQTNQLLRKILFLFCFSNSVISSDSVRKLIKLCEKFITYYFYENNWLKYNSVLCETIMACGALFSTSIFKFLIEALKNGIISTALVALDKKECSENERKAMDITGAIAWSVELLLKNKIDSIRQKTLRLSGQLTKEFEIVFKHDNITMEQRFYVIESLTPLLRFDEKLQRAFHIYTSEKNNDILNIVKEEDARKYLTEAPGYTVTLRIALKLFCANFVFLVAWSPTDEKVQVKGFESSISGAEMNLDIQQSVSVIHNRIIKKTFFYTNNKEDLDQLSQMGHINSSASKRCLGLTELFGAAVDSADGLNYYIIVGYQGNNNGLNTAFYYWLRYKKYLKNILVEIHAKYVQSSHTWNLLRTSYGPLHPPRKGTPRRTILRNWLSEISVGRLLNDVVSLHSHRPKSLKEVEKLITDPSEELNRFTENENPNPLKVTGYWPISLGRSYSDDGRYLTFSEPVLKFLLIECFCNALSFYKSEIIVRFEFQDSIGPKILITVENDIDMAILSEYGATAKESRGTGLDACEKAATAANGQFSHAKANGNFIATITLPVHVMPNSLKEFMK